MKRQLRTSRAPRLLPVACFYCEARFKRAQGRAAHIRYHHPGKAYRPDLMDGKAVDLRVIAGRKPVEPPAHDDEMTPKQHLLAAITAIKRRQEDINKQVPELEKQLQSLRAEQKQMEAELKAIEAALAAIQKSSAQQ